MNTDLNFSSLMESEGGDGLSSFLINRKAPTV